MSLIFQSPSNDDGGNYVVKAVNAVGEKDCTLALNFGGPLGDEENIPAKVYEQPELKQPDPATLILVRAQLFILSILQTGPNDDL